MRCPSCDEVSLCVARDETGRVRRICSECGFNEEASAAEVHEFLQGFETEGKLFTAAAAPSRDPITSIEEALRALAKPEEGTSD